MLADDYRKTQYRKHLEAQESQLIAQDPILSDNMDASETKTHAKSASKAMLALESQAYAEDEDVKLSENDFIAGKRYSIWKMVLSLDGRDY
jgi:hypothetical protein